MIIDNNQHLLQYKNLNNELIVSLFTLKPFNFNREQVSNNKINKQYEILENTINYKFKKDKLILITLCV